MPLKLTEGNLDSPSQGISFEYQDDAETIPCSITPDALRDLGDYHQLDFSEDDLVRVLLREIERLVRAKRRPDRAEDDALVIGTADLLRYGFDGAAARRSA
jgi:hypothetical protein